MNDYGRLNACNYYVVCGWFVTELKLKGLELELFSIIYGFSQARGCYKGTLKYLEDWTSASNSGVRKTLISLEEKGFIVKTTQVFNNVINNEYKVSEELLGEGALLSNGVRYSVTGCATEWRGESLSGGNENNNINNHINNINNKEELILEKEKTYKKEKESLQEDDSTIIMFEQFWKAYPRKVARKTAFTAFKNIKHLKEEFPKIMQAINYKKGTQDWLKDNGRFIPHPTTYLHQERWKDEEKTISTNDSMLSSDNPYFSKEMREMLRSMGR